MERARKEKAPVPVEAWVLAAMEKEKVAAKVAARDKAVDAARDKAKRKFAVRHRGKAADRISRLLLEKGA